MENQELENGKFDINEKEINKLIIESVKSEYKTFFKKFTDFLSNNSTTSKPILKSIIKNLIISAKDELLDLKGNDRIYTKYERDKLKLICERLENDIEHEMDISKQTRKVESNEIVYSYKADPQNGVYIDPLNGGKLTP